MVGGQSKKQKARVCRIEQERHAAARHKSTCTGGTYCTFALHGGGGVVLFGFVFFAPQFDMGRVEYRVWTLWIWGGGRQVGGGIQVI